MISKRISDISCDEEQFDKAKSLYDKALEKSGYSDKLKYVKTPKPKRNRKRNIIWFNPPNRSHVKTNVGKIFMGLVAKHFPRHHKYHKLFNRNNVKVSYSCMPSMASLINRHNAKLLKPSENQPERKCNCRDQASCPLNGECLKSCFAYNALVSSASGDTNYLGCTEGPFKGRYNQHTLSFRDRSHEKDTDISEYIWQLKDKKEDYTITWSVNALRMWYEEV